MSVNGTSELNQDEGFDLWYYCLGHSFLLRSDFLRHLSKNIEYKLCYVCLLAKLQRLSFLISQYKFKRCFDLMHFDIWGLRNEISYDG